MKHSIVTILIVLFAGTTALAYPVTVDYTDGPQDPLVVPNFVHELGTSPAFDLFPEELIEATDTLIDLTVCFDPDTPDDLAVLNTLVTMTNKTNIAWKDVWYVADWDSTTHSNFDGFVFGAGSPLPGTAFHIDSKLNNPLDIHTPLIAESGLLNDIFEPGETWQFVIQDYFNTLGKPASLQV